MANDRNQGPEKKGVPGGFLIFLFAVFLIIFAIQSMTGDKGAKISFSHQVEHLINLDLVKPQENRKIAQNDKLVTFTGKFRDQETQVGKERFRFLELLSANHEINYEKSRILKEIDTLQQNAKEAATLFLKLSSTNIGPEGFVVVDSSYATLGRTNSIVIKQIGGVSDGGVNLNSIREDLAILDKKGMDPVILAKAQKGLLTLVKIFKSPSLGIGNDTFKTELKNLEKKLQGNQDLALCKEAFAYLNTISTALIAEKDGVRLGLLRSVRGYIEKLEQYNGIEARLEKNEALLGKARQKVSSVTWYFNDEELSTNALEKKDSELFAHWFINAKKEWDNFPVNRSLSFKAPDQTRSNVLEKTFKSEEPSPNYFSYIFTILPFLMVFLVLYFIYSRQMKGVGSSALNFGKSPAKMLTKESIKVTFEDVAGADEAKEELKEIVDFLKDPRKFTALGARIPKGVLLVGPPGTGKTLVAKAVAGEADRPFFSISGSDFVEMFVGVGASRIRDLFEQAKRNAPCIVFIDEIDAVGRHRGAGIGGGHDEREQTLNQLLVEMDGFDTKEGVILMAATNRPDILDRALLRPGRFDRRVVLDLPDIRGRYEILKVHARKIKIDAGVDLMEVARNTPGSSGADLGNILNEAALLAARRGRSAVTQQEVRDACDKVRFGKERRSLEMDEKEKRTTAYHESGHAMVGLKVENSDPVEKVTIIPRGFALGATHFMPKKNRLSYWRKEIIDQLAILMGGRAAEELFVNDMSSGAQQDINQATKLARAMVCEWGMSQELGNVTYDEHVGGEQYLGIYGHHEKNYSNETAKLIDVEVKKLIDEAHQRARGIIDENKDKVQLMTDMLIEFETLDSTDIKEILDGSWNVEKKRERLKVQENLQKKTPPPPPPKEKVKKASAEEKFA